MCAADSEVEAVLAYRNALENALGQPAAAHPVEGYGASSLSLAQVLLLASGFLSMLVVLTHRCSGWLTCAPVT